MYLIVQDFLVPSATMLSAFIIMAAPIGITFSVVGTTVAFMFSITSSITAAIFFIASMTAAIAIATRKLLYFLHDFSKHFITSFEIQLSINFNKQCKSISEIYKKNTKL